MLITQNEATSLETLEKAIHILDKQSRMNTFMGSTCIVALVYIGYKSYKEWSERWHNEPSVDDKLKTVVMNQLSMGRMITSADYNVHTNISTTNDKLNHIQSRLELLARNIKDKQAKQAKQDKQAKSDLSEYTVIEENKN
jgi:hypothetical protein